MSELSTLLRNIFAAQWVNCCGDAAAASTNENGHEGVYRGYGRLAALSRRRVS